MKNFILLFHCFQSTPLIEEPEGMYTESGKDNEGILGRWGWDALGEEERRQGGGQEERKRGRDKEEGRPLFFAARTEAISRKTNENTQP